MSKCTGCLSVQDVTLILDEMHKQYGTIIKGLKSRVEDAEKSIQVLTESMQK